MGIQIVRKEREREREKKRREKNYRSGERREEETLSPRERTTNFVKPRSTRKDRSLTELSGDTVKLTSVCPPTYLPTYFRPRTSSDTVRGCVDFAIHQQTERISRVRGSKYLNEWDFHHAKFVEESKKAAEKKRETYCKRVYVCVCVCGDAKIKQEGRKRRPR